MTVHRMSIYLAYLLRHCPEELELSMDIHGWVPVEELIRRISDLTPELLEEIVRSDSKGRFRFSGDGSKIKACQGHSIPWVEPELRYTRPPAVLYHGTTAESYEKICLSGAIDRMGRHAVHMQATSEMAWQSARRWHRTPVLLQIDADRMYAEGYVFGVSDNGVWCTEQVPASYICGVIREN